jgi:Protein of unknown function (DUF3309)
LLLAAAGRTGGHSKLTSWNFVAFPTFCWRVGKERGIPMLGTILIIILILLLIGALPTWPYSTGWGYYPGGGLGLILVIVIILVLVGRI